MILEIHLNSFPMKYITYCLVGFYLHLMGVCYVTNNELLKIKDHFILYCILQNSRQHFSNFENVV